MLTAIAVLMRFGVGTTIDPLTLMPPWPQTACSTAVLSVRFPPKA
jgi:hypothetical protein